MSQKSCSSDFQSIQETLRVKLWGGNMGCENKCTHYQAGFGHFRFEQQASEGLETPWDTISFTVTYLASKKYTLT